MSLLGNMINYGTNLSNSNTQQDIQILEAKVDNNTILITDLETDVSQNTYDISQNTYDISMIEAEQIIQNTNINTLQTDVSNNSTDINTLQTDITNLEYILTDQSYDSTTDTTVILNKLRLETAQGLTATTVPPMITLRNTNSNVCLSFMSGIANDRNYFTRLNQKLGYGDGDCLILAHNYAGGSVNYGAGLVISNQGTNIGCYGMRIDFSPAGESLLTSGINIQGTIRTPAIILNGVNLQTTLNSLRVDIDLNTSDISTIQGDITTIQGDITTIQGDITTIETEGNTWSQNKNANGFNLSNVDELTAQNTIYQIIW